MSLTDDGEDSTALQHFEFKYPKGYKEKQVPLQSLLKWDYKYK